MRSGALAVVVGAALFVAGLLLGTDDWIIRSQPLPGRLFGWPLDPSKCAFLAACLVAILVARVAPRAGDLAQLALGLAFFVGACGWRYTAGLGLVALLVYAVGDRIHPHLAMALTAALLLAGARFAFGTRPFETGARMTIGAAAWRMIYYSFELRSIPRARRSLVGMFAYAPFGLLLAPGPVQLSYLTWSSVRPREELDRLGSRQLLRAGAKLVGFALALHAVRAWLPPVASFASAPLAARAIFVVLPYPLFFAHISIRADVGAALSNLAGHHAPDAFHWPFLAKNPFELWRRWNIHVVDFLRRAFIYEAARRNRSLIVMIFAGMAGSALFHAFATVFAGPETGVGELVRLGVGYVGISGAILLLALPLERRRKGLALVPTLVVAAVTQLLAVLVCFVYLQPIAYGSSLPGSPLCLLVGLFARPPAAMCGG